MLTNYVKNIILEAMGGIGYSSTASSKSIPYGFYLGLSSTTPNVDGSNFTEPSSTLGYQRVKICQGAGNPFFPFIKDPDDSHSAINSLEIHYNVATANWGDPLTHVGIFSSNGTLLAYGLLVDSEGDPSPITVLKDHIPTILQGQARITIDIE